MLKSMYSGVTGMRGFQTKLDTIGNNIANVNTVGYKKSRVMFQDLLSQNMGGGGVNPKQVGLGSANSSIDVLHNPGSPMATGVSTDLAIDGKGFFLIKHTDGRELLTKGGNFYLDQNRVLKNSQGFEVMGYKMDPQLDANGNPVVDAAGNPQFTTDKTQRVNIDVPLNFTVNAKGQVIDLDTKQPVFALAVSAPSNPSGLNKIGGSTYEMTAQANPNGALDDNTADAIGVQINSGQLEMSNVDLTEEFTEMIVAQRGFQANSKIITTSDEILQEIVNLKR
ncbi:flagellar hook-basal body complex protein [Pseudalkalibacillus caeni]|uniref:Flagellar hook protein FlgE n=1 Tax=Exobacillus caeni TaxID=2574798 RepID=A0A5R9F4R6_9BACL|nr:flagellar hook-basal body complex protein [Pseudalkalibacillus caeni]TLS36638.1 flagellar hook-basal body complex protein [Pseudalkalibacillus caeni]